MILLFRVNGGGGDAAHAESPSPTDVIKQISQTLTLPTNVERVYLDVIAQSQINDEFWYLCVPNDQTSNLLSCGNTAFRETEVWIDGWLAGVAPGISVDLHRRYRSLFVGANSRGVRQTARFLLIPRSCRPRRCSAGVLSDGGQHTGSQSVFTTPTATSWQPPNSRLLVFEDHGAKTVTGGLLTNTLTEPNPVVQENVITGAGPTYTGSVTVELESELHDQRITSTRRTAAWRQLSTRRWTSSANRSSTSTRPPISRTRSRRPRLIQKRPRREVQTQARLRSSSPTR